jgi:hypothetical protein
MPSKEGGLHPTLLRIAIHELAVRLHSASIPYASEASLSDDDGANDVGNSCNDSPVHHCATMTSEGIM